MLTAPIPSKIRSRLSRLTALTQATKKALMGLFVLKPKSLDEPRLDGGRAVLSFPCLQRLVVAALGFDDFTGVRIFEDLHLARLKVAVMDKTAGARRRQTLWIE
jgi:hypothetical protein